MCCAWSSMPPAYPSGASGSRLPGRACPSRQASPSNCVCVTSGTTRVVLRHSVCVTADDDHSDLRGTWARLNSRLRDLRQNLDFGDDTFHVEFADKANRAANLALHLDAAVQLADQHLYGPAFAVTRSCLEHAVVDWLVFLGHTYVEHISGVSEEGWAQWQADCEAGADWTKDVQLIRTRKGVTIRRGGLYTEPDEHGNREQLSIYYFLLQEYDGLIGRPADQEDDEFLTGDELRALATENQARWQTYLRWSALLDNLVVNNSSKKQTSGGSVCTTRSCRPSHTRSPTPNAVCTANTSTASRRTTTTTRANSFCSTSSRSPRWSWRTTATESRKAWVPTLRIRKVWTPTSGSSGSSPANSGSSGSTLTCGTSTGRRTGRPYGGSERAVQNSHPFRRRQACRSHATRCCGSSVSTQAPGAGSRGRSTRAPGRAQTPPGCDSSHPSGRRR